MNTKILVIDLAFIGDVVLTAPVLRSLKGKYPDSEITMLTVPVTVPVAEMLPYVDHVFSYDKRGADKGWWGMLKLARRLRKQRFDLAVCMNFAVRGAVVAWLAGIPLRTGYDIQHGRWFLNRLASPQRQGTKHERLNHLEVLQALEIEPTKDTSLVLCVPSQARASMEKKLNFPLEQKSRLVICPYGSYARKNLPESLLVQIIKEMKDDYDICLIGDSKAAGVFASIGNACQLSQEKLLAGTLTLQELTAFLENADCLLTVDTGPQHMAQAVNCPTVAVFGPTDPRVWGPVHKDDIVLYRGEECSPCWGKGDCVQAKCIVNLKADDIIRAVHKRMGLQGKE